MMYSLARFRWAKPIPPFALGGEYLRGENRHFLKDATGLIELEGQDGCFRSFNSGDLIAVEVVTAEEFKVRVLSAHRILAVGTGSEAPPKPHAARFALFINRVRTFFLERGLSEVFTPTLVPCPGLEPTLEPIACVVSFGRQSQTVYLPTSPEIHLKKALTGGWTDIFEIRPCFRNGERSPHHESEFFMLEWYRAFADLSWIEQDVRDLIAVLGTEGWIQGGVPRLETTDWETLFAELFGFSLRPDSSTEELSRLCGSTGIHYAQDDTFNDLFHRLVIERIEPELKSRGPTLVYRFPPSLAALAKLDEQGWADRMELYWRGLEIANAFNEVNEAEEQQRRWLEEMAERERLGTLFVPDDQDLIQRMRRSMPPAGGIALGLERLYMACAELTHIQDLKPFTTGDLFTSR